MRKKVSFDIDEDVYEKVKHRAKVENLKIADIFRKAVSDFLEKGNDNVFSAFIVDPADGNLRKMNFSLDEYETIRKEKLLDNFLKKELGFRDAGFLIDRKTGQKIKYYAPERIPETLTPRRTAYDLLRKKELTPAVRELILSNDPVFGWSEYEFDNDMSPVTILRDPAYDLLTDNDLSDDELAAIENSMRPPAHKKPGM